MAQHTIPPRVYYSIFLALMVLTVTTVWVAFLDLGVFNNVVALGIASTKATLVLLFFMHLKYSSKLTWVFVLSGFFFLGVLLTITVSDVLTRGWDVLASGW
ncbi:MAG: cytochrome C oxidase subunit IV family protein [bacterium]